MQKITRLAAVLLIALAVVLAIVAFSLGRHALQPPASQPLAASPASAPAAASPATMSVVAAAAALPAGQPIPASALRLAGATQLPPDAYVSIGAVSGDIPLVDIPAGATITAGLLAHGVALALKPGERALSLPVDELTAAGNRIQPGDYVDVFLSLKPAPGAGPSEAKQPTQTRLLLSRLRVLAYGSQDLPNPSAASRPATGAAEKNAVATGGSSAPPPPRTAVLAVPVDEVDRLLLGVQDGKLSLALRHPGDVGRPDDDLFPQPRNVLTPLASLSDEQRQQLLAPENRAYAGLDGNGLAGQAAAATARPAPSHRSSNAQGIEIIRGSQAHSL